MYHSGYKKVKPVLLQYLKYCYNIMLKKSFLRTFHYPILCNKIDIINNPWGWKSLDEINKLIDYKIPESKINIKNYDRKYIHEYKLRNYTEEMYNKTYYAYLNNYDFLNSPLFSPKLANGLNQLRSMSNLANFGDKINIKKVEMIDSWIKYGRINNSNKFLGYYDYQEIMHEISVGIIGPEIQSIWDQRSIKQKVRFLIESKNRKDVFDFERDLMTMNDNWQLCNINRIII